MEGRPLDDADLVERARGGDAAAYEVLVVRYQELAFRVAYLQSGDAEASRDAAQSAFIKAYYALKRFRPGAPFRPWLLKIVANEARNQARAAGRRARHELHLAESPPRVDSAQSPEAAALVGEERAALLRAINALPEQDRLVITYRYLLDLSEAEMAVALGCRPGTVKSRLSRALTRLRAQTHAPGTEAPPSRAHHD